ncbi:hypothetical protein ES319_D12G058600v1 [Gossypium barbadense]|uniref:Uncharacterized protein n=1 Tax=Gossypium barbadense TaxID=3634 RepID=A0A5J5NXH7_GOSBA|nr:hypothetical protein ES319_D12G058600v1 [Gossypium barbadense]
MQGRSFMGLHVFASAVRVSLENITTASASTHKATKETQETLIIFFFFSPTQAANTKKAKKLNGTGCILGYDLRHNL